MASTSSIDTILRLVSRRSNNDCREEQSSKLWVLINLHRYRYLQVLGKLANSRDVLGNLERWTLIWKAKADREVSKLNKTCTGVSANTLKRRIMHWNQLI